MANSVHSQSSGQTHSNVTPSNPKKQLKPSISKTPKPKTRTTQAWGKSGNRFDALAPADNEDPQDNASSSAKPVPSGRPDLSASPAMATADPNPAGQSTGLPIKWPSQPILPPKPHPKTTLSVPSYDIEDLSKKPFQSTHSYHDLGIEGEVADDSDDSDDPRTAKHHKKKAQSKATKRLYEDMGSKPNDDSFWQKAVKTDWRLRLTNVNNPNGKPKQPKMNRGIIRTRYGAATDDKIEITLNRKNRPNGFRVAPETTEGRVAMPVLAEEVHMRRPANYLKNYFPWDTSGFDHKYYSKLSDEKKRDPEIMNHVALKQSETLQQSLGNYRSLMWKREKLIDRMEHNDLERREEIRQNEELRRENAALKAELEKSQRINSMYRKEAMNDEVAELIDTCKYHVRSFEDIKTYLSNMSEKYQESELAFATEMDNLKAIISEEQSTLSTLIETLEELKQMKQRFSRDLHESHRKYKLDFIEHYKQAANEAGDANIARISHRNGLIQGRHLGRKDQNIRHVAAQAAQIAHDRALERSNGRWIDMCKTFESEFTDSAMFYGEIRGILMGVNMEKALQSNQYDHPEMSFEKIAANARMIGEVARACFKANLLPEYLKGVFTKGHPTCILHPKHGIEGGSKDPLSFHGQILRTFDGETHEFDLPPEPSPLQPVYVENEIDAGLIEEIIQNSKDHEAAAYELATSNIPSWLNRDS